MSGTFGYDGSNSKSPAKIVEYFTCPVCGKKFHISAGTKSFYVYKKGNKMMCSYSCYRKDGKK